MDGKAFQNSLRIGKLASDQLSDRRASGVISMILLHN